MAKCGSSISRVSLTLNPGYEPGGPGHRPRDGRRLAAHSGTV